MAKCQLCDCEFKTAGHMKKHLISHVGRTEPNGARWGKIGKVIHLRSYFQMHDQLLNGDSGLSSFGFLKQVRRNQDFFLAKLNLQNVPYEQLTEFEKRSLLFCTHPRLLNFTERWLIKHDIGTHSSRYSEESFKNELRHITGVIIGEVHNLIPDFTLSQESVEGPLNADLPDDFWEQVLELPQDFWMKDWTKDNVYSAFPTLYAARIAAGDHAVPITSATDNH